MSAQWSLSGGKQTWGGLPLSVAIDPFETSADRRRRPVWTEPISQPDASWALSRQARSGKWRTSTTYSIPTDGWLHRIRRIPSGPGSPACLRPGSYIRFAGQIVEVRTHLARPDGNITGVSVDAGLGVYDKRLQFLSETVRNLRNARVLIPPSAMMFWETGLAPLREVAGRVGIRIAVALLSEKLDRPAYERVFDEMETDRVDGLIVSHHGEQLTNRQLIADLAAKRRLPAVYPHRDLVDVGGLLSYGSDLGDVMRRLADMTDQVMKGAKPADIPFTSKPNSSWCSIEQRQNRLGWNFR